MKNINPNYIILALTAALSVSLYFNCRHKDDDICNIAAPCDTVYAEVVVDSIPGPSDYQEPLMINGMTQAEYEQWERERNERILEEHRKKVNNRSRYITYDDDDDNEYEDEDDYMANEEDDLRFYYGL